MMNNAHVKVYSWSDIEKEPLAEGIRRQMVTGERIMVALIELDEGAEVPLHDHENEQVSYVQKGRLRFWIGENGEQQIDAGAGEVVIVPSNVPHRVLALETSLSIDIFNPPRQDWFDGTDDYLRGR